MLAPGAVGTGITTLGALMPEATATATTIVTVAAANPEKMAQAVIVIGETMARVGAAASKIQNR